MEYNIAIKMNELLIHATTYLNLKIIMLSGKKADQKEYIVYDSLYVKL